MHTGPPLPPFAHWAHDSPQPPLPAPPQFRVTGAAASQVPDAGLPNCCITAGGVVESEEEPPPPPPAGTLRARNFVEDPQAKPPAPATRTLPDAVDVMVVLAAFARVPDGEAVDPLGRVRVRLPPALFVNVKLSPESRVTIGADSTRAPLLHVTVIVEGEAAAYTGEAESIPPVSTKAVAENRDVDFDGRIK